MKRRDFLKLGVLGTTGALLGWDGLAGAAQKASGPLPFPAPVYRTLGRTGLKITVVSFGAMLTPEPEVIRVAFEHGVNYVDTARRLHERPKRGDRRQGPEGHAPQGLRGHEDPLEFQNERGHRSRTSKRASAHWRRTTSTSSSCTT